MREFLTCVDAVWYENDWRTKGMYEATLYTVQANIHVGVTTRITQKSIIQVLDAAPVVARRYLQRPVGQQCDIIYLMRALCTMPQEATLFTWDNSSQRQRIWSGFDRWESEIGNLRFIMRSSDAIQYPPFGDYYTTTDSLLERLETSWRRLDAQSISHGFPAKMKQYLE